MGRKGKRNGEGKSIYCVRGVVSPLLSNILLDDLDKELERRGPRVARSCADFLIGVKSRPAGERGKASLRPFLQQHLEAGDQGSQESGRRHQ